MTFCSQCGKELPSNAQGQCPSCGMVFDTTSQSKREVVIRTVPYKSPGTAALIAFVGAIFGLPGIGHMYVGHVGRGIGILLGGLALYILAWLTFVGSLIAGGFGGGANLFQAGWTMAFIIGLAYVALLIWQIFNARSLAKKHNERARITSADP